MLLGYYHTVHTQWCCGKRILNYLTMLNVTVVHTPTQSYCTIIIAKIPFHCLLLDSTTHPSLLC